MKYLVFLKDTDPDTGKVCQLIRLCECDLQDVAESICYAMSTGDDASPNREYYIEASERNKTVFVCAKLEDIQAAYECQIQLNTAGIRCISVFSKEELELIGDVYKTYSVPFSIIQIGISDVWDRLDYNLQVEAFTESTVIDVINYLSESVQ